MSAVDRFRRAMARYFDQPLTPEIAAAIEAEAFTPPDLTIDPAQFPPMQCGSLTFHVERLSEIRAEMHVLHEAHWAETETYRHCHQLAMDYPALEAEERAGTMIQVTARAGEQLVGNMRMYLRTSRHTGKRVAVEDTLFLLPAYRRGRAAAQLLRYTQRCLNALGYREFHITTKLTSPAAGRLLEFGGFKAVATEYVLIEGETDVL